MTIPVVIKGGRGAERTASANISAHGIAVFSDRKMPVRQYVELELYVPPNESKVSVTAMVARTTDVLKDRHGGHRPGVAFDFYLFDTQGRATWRSFIEQLRAGARPASPDVEETTPAAETAPPPRTSGRFDDDVGTTFIVKPRDAQRLKNFLRGELSQGKVRIETPVLKPIGTPVEVLVVHPDTNVEWALPGKVKVASETGRGRGPMLEVEIDETSEDEKRRFREFVDTGRISARESARSGRAQEASRARPPDPASARSPKPPPREPSERDVAAETDLALLPISRRERPAGPPSRSKLPMRPPSEVSEERRRPSEEPPAGARRRPSEEPARRRPSEEPPAPSRREDPAPRRRPSEDAPDPRRAGRPAELAAPSAPLGARPPPEATTAPERVASSAQAAPSGAFASFFQEFSRNNDLPEKEAGFDDEIETAPERQAAPAASQLPEILPGGPRGARSTHSSLSTEGTSPELDRQVALARARLVKSPESVQAMLQLGRLLTQRKKAQNLDEALVLFNRIVVADPTHAEAHVAASEVLLELGRPDEAKARLDRVRLLGGRVDAELERRIAAVRER
ncbi:MAG: PilZ domain-containing protein [Deltaproteobacteria bacterium]|nr:PilZ domain-containing protein [Deltaproteobacteria bacterium]